MRAFSSALCALALVLASAGAARAAGEVNGRIVGNVVEAQTGAPVPGASVTVSGRALIGPAKVVTTSEDGRYEVVELPPGSYDIEVSYSGVKPIRRRVVVRQGEATPVDIQWSAELAETETTIVVEERHMTRPDSTQSGSVVSADSEAKIAINHRYQQIVSQSAGVTQPDPAALQFAVKGGSILANRWLVDGMDITDPASNTWSANINFDSVASVDIITGGMEAQYNSLGGVIDLITAAGSDEWHVDSSFYVNDTSFSTSSKAGPGLYNGYRAFDTKPTPPTSSYQANINFGGPILKHRLWFNISAEYLFEQFSVPSGPPLNIQHPAYFRHQFLGRGKLTWAPNEKHRVTLAFNTDPAWLYNIDGRFYGLSNYERGVAETQQNQGGFFGTLQWEYFKSQNLNTMFQVGFQNETIDFGSQGILGGPGAIDFGPGCPNPMDPSCTYDANRARHTNSIDNTNWFQGQPIQREKLYSAIFDPSISLRGRAGGYHDAKIGLQTKYSYGSNQYQTPGGYVYTDGGLPTNSNMMMGAGGLCDEMAGTAGHSGLNCYQRTATQDSTLTAQGIGVGLFIQDRWKPTKWLTIVPGIRFDYGWTQNNYGKTVSSLFGVGPRIGAVVDLTRDQKTIFTVYYGRANEVMSLLPAFTTNAPNASTQKWNPMTNQWELLNNSGGPGGFQIDPNAKTPHTDEFATSLRRELFTNSVGSIEYTYKQISNIWDGVEINQIWDPTGTKVRGFANGNPQTLYLLTTPDKNYRIYQGVDFSVEARPTPNWDIWAAYTLSWLYGPGAEELGQVGGAGEPGASGFYNPRQLAYYDGFLPEDHRHNLKIRISYQWKGLTVGSFFSYLSGAPLSKQFFNGYDGGYTNRRAPQGNDPSGQNDFTRWSEFRMPDLIQIDARAQYDFSSLIKAHVILIADFFNLFNIQSATALDSTDVATFASVQNRQKPFRFQIGLRYLY